MRFRAALVLAALTSLLVGGIIFYQSSRAVSEATKQVRRGHGISFQALQLSTFPPANTQILSAPASFTDASLLEGKLYLCGPSGLSAGHSRYQVGGQLPPGPLVAMTRGIVAGSSEPELWIATAGEGLLAFNGSRFRQIRPDRPELRKLTSVLALSTGRILFGTEKSGVLVYDGQRITPLHESLQSMHVTALAGTDSGVWIGTLDRGLLHWHAGQVDRYDSLPDKHVLSIAISGNTAFAGTALGVALIRHGRVERTLSEGTFARALHATSDRLTIGTVDEGVIELPLPKGSARFYEASAAVERLVDADGRLLALTREGVFEARSWQPVVTKDPALLKDRNISALSFDATGRLWVGYFDRGLDIVDPGFTKVHHLEDEHLFCVNKIEHAKDAHLVATANGLVMLDDSGRKRQVLGRSDGLIANHVTDVLVDDHRTTLATPAGITILDKSGPRSLYALHGLVNNHAYTLGEANGRLLVGTLGGLSLLEGDLVQASYTTSNSAIRHNWVTAIARAGTHWYIGTYGEGVSKLDSSGAWQTFEGMKGTVINPNAIKVWDDRVFAGTLGDGLLIYEGGRWRRRTDGLPSLNVTAIAAHGNQLLIGTDNGLVRLQ